MRAQVFLFSLLFLVLSVGCHKTAPLPRRVNTIARGPLVCETTTECQPAPPLLELLSLLDVKHQNTLTSIVDVTQAWLRPRGKERWEMKDVFASKRAEVIPLLEQMGLIDPIKASRENYEYGVILGSLANNVRNRINFLADEWERGVRCKQLVFLGGERFLDPKQEPMANIITPTNAARLKKGWRFDGGLPKTETDMMKIIFSQTELPQGMEKLKVVFVDAPAKKRSDGTWTRPNTGDTVVSWLNHDVPPGSVLAVSTQPFVLYQDAVLKTLLPRSFVVETIGAGAPSLPVSVHLDNLARLLYQERLKQND